MAAFQLYRANENVASTIDACMPALTCAMRGSHRLGRALLVQRLLHVGVHSMSAATCGTKV